MVGEVLRGQRAGPRDGKQVRNDMVKAPEGAESNRGNVHSPARLGADRAG
jgi:hypothetical protein